MPDRQSGLRVAISQRVEIVPSYGEVRDCLDQQWSLWLESLGLTAIAVPNRTHNVARFCQSMGISAIFLSGGNNFSGQVYEDETVQISGGSVHRDTTESALIDYAIASRIPLLAWCRGLQVLQVYFGGKLVSTAAGPVSHVASTHDVEIVSESHQVLAGPTLHVNSFHDFGVTRASLASPLRELAISRADGLVEAVYHPELPIVGCQWHPERAHGSDGFNRALVQHFISPQDQP